MYNAIVTIVGWFCTALFIAGWIGWGIGVATAAFFVYAWPVPRRVLESLWKKTKGGVKQ